MHASLLIFAWIVAGPPPAPTYSPPDATVLREAMSRAKDRPAAERISTLTEPFVGAPYLLNPLGEGSGTDADPRYRADAFDCTTFVETGIAMTLIDDPARMTDVLDLIRYRRGQPTFAARRHFPESEWLPELIELGILKDVTRDVAGDDVVVATKRIDLRRWRGFKTSHLGGLPEARIPTHEASLDVWPIAKARAGWRRIPPGTVLSVVRADKASVPARVTHQGLVVEKDGELFLRHAARSVYHRVVDEPLSWFLARNAKYKKWPVLGVHLARVADPDPDWRTRAATWAPPQTTTAAQSR